MLRLIRYRAPTGIAQAHHERRTRLPAAIIEPFAMEGADAPLSFRRAPMNEPVFDIRKRALMDRSLHVSLSPDSP